MKYNFCTLFDKNYLHKGLALYYSIKNHCDDFNFFILPMDAETFYILKKMKLKNVFLISLKDFEDANLLKAKKNRNSVEYYWTCTPSLILFILKKYPELDSVTYLDSDLFFFANPKSIFDELNKNSILITEHDFAPNIPKFFIKKFGIFNVQFLIFKNDINAFKVLKWWREKNNEWCYNKHEEGRFGDQLYLNNWPDKFKGVHVLQNRKFCLGPWNAIKYQIYFKNNKIFIDKTELVFYHFHGFNILNKNKFYLIHPPFAINIVVKNIIYKSYIRKIKEMILILEKVDPNFKYGFINFSFKEKIKNLIKKFFYYNIYSKFKKL